MNDGDKFSFFKQSVRPSSTWACLISTAGAREAGMPSRTEPAGQRYAIKVGSTGDVVGGASYIIQLLCFLYKFFYLTLFDILRSCFFLINFFRLPCVGTVPNYLIIVFYIKIANFRALFGRHHSIQFINNTS